MVTERLIQDGIGSSISSSTNNCISSSTSSNNSQFQHFLLQQQPNVVGCKMIELLTQVGNRELKEGVCKPRLIRNYGLSGFYEEVMPSDNPVPTKTFMTGRKVQRLLLQLHTKTVGRMVIELTSQVPNNLSSSPTSCNNESPVRAVQNKAELWQNFKTAQDSNNCMAGSSWKVPTGVNEVPWRGRILTGFHELGGVPDPSGSDAAPMHE